MQYTQHQRLAPEAPDESALYSPIGPQITYTFEMQGVQMLSFLNGALASWHAGQDRYATLPV